jgi:hypothetical protein
VIIGKLSSYARKNRTKKALWELDNLHRSRYLLSYVDSLRLRRNVQRALNRGESYHKLVRAVAYANGGRLRARADLEQELWSECSRFLANCVIHYNACILSELLEYAEREKDFDLGERIKRISPVSWKHVNFYGEYTFRDIGYVIDIGGMVNRLMMLRRDRGTTTIPSFLGHKAVSLRFCRAQKNDRYFGINFRGPKRPDPDRIKALFRTKKLIYEI